MKSILALDESPLKTQRPNSFFKETFGHYSPRLELSFLTEVTLKYVQTDKLFKRNKIYLSLVFLPIRITLKQFLEGFLERLFVSFTKNSFKKRFYVILMMALGAFVTYINSYFWLKLYWALVYTNYIKIG
jgi:hypothetical protein